MNTYAFSQEASEEVFELSPFVVSTEQDDGFVAANSLAGGRLSSSLKNTPAAYSVQTREFIDALGLVDLTEALEWTVNATSVEEEGRLAIFGNGDQTLSIRGVTSTGRQRNFFPLNLQFDSYNLDRFDYARGPNAILFGAGSFSGTPNVVTKRALLSEDFGEAQFRIGSWDHLRTTFDYNKVINEKFAARVNVMWQDSKGWRNFEYDRRKAATLATTWQIAENTSLLLEAEVGEFEENRPFTYFSDKFTGWDGQTVFDALVTNATTPGNGVARPAGVTRTGGGNDSNPFLVYVPEFGGSILDYASTMTTVGGNRWPQTLIGGVAVPNGAPNIQHRDRPIIGIDNLFPGRFDAAVAGSAFEVPDASFTLSTDVPTVEKEYDTYSGFFRHRFGQNLHFELGLNVAEEARETNYLNARDLDEVFIDINRKLPTGEDPTASNFSGGVDNPMFLEPYGHGRRSWGSFGTKYTNGRIATAYTIPETQFGRYVLSLMGGFSDSKFRKKISSYRLLDSDDPREWASGESVWYRYYWNGGNFSLPEINEAVIDGETIPVGWVPDGDRPQDVSLVNTSYDYAQAAINATLFNSKLNLILAARYDDLAIEQDYNRNYADYPENWDGSTIYYRQPAPANYLDLTEAEQSQYSPPSINPKETTYSLGSVYHLTERFSVFANYATGYNPPASETRLRLDGTIMPTPVSKGTDIGLRFSFLNEKLHGSVSRYDAEETAQPFEINFRNELQRIHRANVVGDLSPEGVNARGFPLVPNQPFDQRDMSASGYEFEVVANVSDQLRISANLALADASAIDAWQDTLAFLDEWTDTMKQIVIDSGAYFATDGRAVEDDTIAEDQRPDAADAVGAYNQIFFNRLPNIGTESGREQKLTGLTETTGNLFADYTFREGKLKGFKIGLGANYRGKKVIGFRGLDTIQDPDAPNDPTAAIDDPDVDEYTPAYSAPYWLTTMTLGYKMKLKEDRDLRFQLRVSNLFDEDQPIAGTRIHLLPPDGDFLNTAARVSTGTRFRWQTPRSYTLTTTYSF
ncbi:TonB-dependent receptor [Pelagicoccus enzymogenes]|uniref:TonB-dependent siderophore receptor n=1 Tax=Pelagicoccus enzymogenes TaxID=2773457 RepID=UPI0028100687|nr:TonB-dependent receptor [Pelagicoccus enzymogenes]MDQ8201204.1 TonB-dependent receptor [Pelagicoccus enzymogenes]